MRKSKQLDDFLMSNIQVVYMQKKLLKKSDFHELIQLNQWEDIRRFLARFDYSLRGEVTVETIDDLYQDNLAKLEETLFQLNFPDEYLKVLFVKRDIFQKNQGTGYQNLDEKVLAEYSKYAQNGLHPIISSYAKSRIDEFFLNDYFRHSNHQITFKEYAYGNFSRADLDHLESLRLKEGIRWLQHSFYQDVFRDRFHPIELEKRFDNWLIENYQTYRYQTIGLEGIFTYSLEKVYELFNLRLILKSKLYHLPNKEVLERVRTING
ncbi:V-type ATPase subunit [Vagococcus elongatus]|nr:V-type ATPase subunit [Vagococcus elongatus]